MNVFVVQIDSTHVTGFFFFLVLIVVSALYCWPLGPDTTVTIVRKMPRFCSPFPSKTRTPNVL